MSTINSTDLLLVERSGTSYKAEYGDIAPSSYLLFLWPSTSWSSSTANYPSNLQDVLDNGTPCNVGDFSNINKTDYGLVTVIQPGNIGSVYSTTNHTNSSGWRIDTNNPAFFNADGSTRPATTGIYPSYIWTSLQWYAGDGVNAVPANKVDSNAAYFCQNLGTVGCGYNTNVMAIPGTSGGLQASDKLLVNRSGVSYQMPWSDKGKIQNTDLLLIDRSNTSYKVAGADFSIPGGSPGSGGLVKMKDNGAMGSHSGASGLGLSFSKIRKGAGQNYSADDGTSCTSFAITDDGLLYGFTDHTIHRMSSWDTSGKKIVDVFTGYNFGISGASSNPVLLYDDGSLRQSDGVVDTGPYERIIQFASNGNAYAVQKADGSIKVASSKIDENKTFAGLSFGTNKQTLINCPINLPSGGTIVEMCNAGSESYGTGGILVLSSDGYIYVVNSTVSNTITALSNVYVTQQGSWSSPGIWHPMGAGDVRQWTKLSSYSQGGFQNNGFCIMDTNGNIYERNQPFGGNGQQDNSEKSTIFKWNKPSDAGKWLTLPLKAKSSTYSIALYDDGYWYRNNQGPNSGYTKVTNVTGSADDNMYNRDGSYGITDLWCLLPGW